MIAASDHGGADAEVDSRCCTHFPHLLQDLPARAEVTSWEFKELMPFLIFRFSIFPFLRPRHLRIRTFQSKRTYKGIYKITMHA